MFQEKSATTAKKRTAQQKIERKIERWVCSTNALSELRGARVVSAKERAAPVYVQRKDFR